MDILLVSPYDEKSSGLNEATIEVPIGLLSIASFMENKGIRVGLLDAYCQRMPIRKVMQEIRNLKPKIIGISVNIFSFLQAAIYTEEIKKNFPDIKVIWGGPHPTVAAEICLRTAPVDFVVIGEGEITSLELVQGLLQNKDCVALNGAACLVKGEFLLNPLRDRIIDLDGLPFPAYHLLPSLSYYRTRARKKPFMGIVTSRGCPFSCIYCSKDVFKNRVTFRSPQNIIEEIDLLIRKYQIRQIDILDDNFTLDSQRVEALCDLILQRGYRLAISLQSGIRADRVSDSLMVKMKKAGIFKLAFGVESGSPAVLQGIKKELDLDCVLKSAQLARKHGMVVIGFFMIGLPGDTKSSLQETIDFAIAMNPHIANFMMTIPFYGTELYRRIEQEGRFLYDTKNGISGGFYARKAYYEMGGLTEDIMVRYYNKAYHDFYFRISKIMDILGTVKSFSEVKWILEAGVSTLFPN